MKLVALENNNIAYIGKLSDKKDIGEKDKPYLTVFTLEDSVRIPTDKLTHELIDSLSNTRIPITLNAEEIIKQRAVRIYNDNQKAKEPIEIGCSNYILHYLDNYL